VLISTESLSNGGDNHCHEQSGVSATVSLRDVAFDGNSKNLAVNVSSILVLG
jgi:hypothetical protein